MLFFPEGVRDNNTTLLLTVRPVLGYMHCWQKLKSLRYFPLGAQPCPSWFVYYLQLRCFSLLASWLVCKGDSWKSTGRLAQALGGLYHVPKHALDTDMLSDLGPNTCHLCLCFPLCEVLMVVHTSQTVWGCAAAKLPTRQQLALISCGVKASYWERRRLLCHCGTGNILSLHPSWMGSLVGEEWESVVHFAFLCSDTATTCK